MVPADRRYSKEHEWIKVEGDVGTIGITSFAQDQLGDIVYVELPAVDGVVARDAVLGTIESVKAVSEIFSPVGGTVVAVNQQLDSAPELLNRDPHGEGWYCKVRLSDPAEVAALMDAEAYRAYVESQ